MLVSALPPSRTLFMTQCRSGSSRGSIPTEAARRLNGLKLAKIELADRLQRLRGGTLQQIGKASSQAAYSACSVVSVVTASCQRRTRLR